MHNKNFMESYIRQMSEKTPEYADLLYWYKITVFVDLLGFKSLVFANKNLLAIEENILPVLKNLEELTLINNKEDYGVLATQRQVTTFSDSIVASYLVNGSAVIYLFIDLMRIIQIVLDHGLLFRGGIAFGKLYHVDHTVIGEGLVRAYEIESKKAVYPRIVIDGPVMRVFRKILFPSSTESFTFDLVNRSICNDTDRRYIVDIAHLIGPEQCNEKLRAILDRIDRTNRQLLPKILWLEKYLMRRGTKKKIVSIRRFSPGSAVYT